ncbi:MAG: hypothetical protein K2H37_07450 [Lachnospiraceae bacterium]|nr:hypothetical protein [Lachnospiraceae bacterium]
MIRSDTGLGIEIQVRTLYEEAWSEIDHRFDHCLIDILVDLARLKHYHDISLVNYVKLIAYTASWCLKRKTFQLVEGAEEKYIYINEKFALALLMQAGGCYDRKAQYRAEDEDDLVKAVEQIYYHLQYRNTNPQTLELFLVGLESGKKIHILD